MQLQAHALVQLRCPDCVSTVTRMVLVTPFGSPVMALLGYLQVLFALSSCQVDSSSACAYQFDGMQQVLFALSSCQVDSSSASTYQFDRVQQVQFALSSSSRYHVAYQSDRPD